jgi:hypothetical protein
MRQVLKTPRGRGLSQASSKGVRAKPLDFTRTTVARLQREERNGDARPPRRRLLPGTAQSTDAGAAIAMSVNRNAMNSCASSAAARSRFADGSDSPGSGRQPRSLRSPALTRTGQRCARRDGWGDRCSASDPSSEQRRQPERMFPTACVESGEPRCAAQPVVAPGFRALQPIASQDRARSASHGTLPLRHASAFPEAAKFPGATVTGGFIPSANCETGIQALPTLRIRPETSKGSSIKAM